MAVIKLLSAPDYAKKAREFAKVMTWTGPTIIEAGHYSRPQGLVPRRASSHNERVSGAVVASGPVLRPVPPRSALLPGSEGSSGALGTRGSSPVSLRARAQVTTWPLLP